ncbi:uncharacterized protein METZ01_LOCUS330651 [marine metagenome]|uniref:Uncharacterized protein n=1 Tax=marine metagenome TaxID=408172 RepID=A0A382PY46_9ZZZZ
MAYSLDQSNNLFFDKVLWVAICAFVYIYISC